MARARSDASASPQELSHKVYAAASNIHGTGVFAKQSFKKGDYIGTYEGPTAKRNGKYVLWLMDRRRTVGRRGLNLLRYLNHADKPNAEFDGWDLYAKKRIPKDSEITFDYEPEE